MLNGLTIWKEFTNNTSSRSISETLSFNPNPSIETSTLFFKIAIWMQIRWNWIWFIILLFSTLKFYCNSFLKYIWANCSKTVLFYMHYTFLLICLNLIEFIIILPQQYFKYKKGKQSCFNDHVYIFMLPLCYLL